MRGSSCVRFFSHVQRFACHETLAHCGISFLRIANLPRRDRASYQNAVASATPAQHEQRIWPILGEPSYSDLENDIAQTLALLNPFKSEQFLTSAFVKGGMATFAKQFVKGGPSGWGRLGAMNATVNCAEKKYGSEKWPTAEAGRFWIWRRATQVFLSFGVF